MLESICYTSKRKSRLAKQSNLGYVRYTTPSSCTYSTTARNEDVQNAHVNAHAI